MSVEQRKFTKKLIARGSAAQVRETVAINIKETTNLNKPKLVEPLNYETELVRNKTILHNDPLRELLLFPHDDVSQSTIPRRFRTTVPTIPADAPDKAQDLLVRECIKTYSSVWSRVHYKYCNYSAGYTQLPELPRAENTETQIFEVDRDEYDEELLSRQTRTQQTTKQGWLYKGPDNGLESSFIPFAKAYKKRFLCLKQQKDATYVLEYYKDEKKGTAKDPIFLDSASHAIKANKRGKVYMELHMQDKRFYTFAADTDAEIDSWVEALQKVIQSNDQGSIDRLREMDNTPNRASMMNFEKSLEQSMNPELQKYARETESLLAQQRQHGRQKLLSVYPDVQKAPHCPDMTSEATREHELYKETFGSRLLVECDSFSLRLQTNINDGAGPEIIDNPEPFFITFALYDCREGRKISEDFHYDPNHEHLREMLAVSNGPASGSTSPVPNGGKSGRYSKIMNGAERGVPNNSVQGLAEGFRPDWLQYPCRALFSVSNPHPEIFLVARIEKVLQGNINQSAEPYTKSPDLKMGGKIHKNIRQYCGKLGQYRMPFAWAARPMFKKAKAQGGLWFDSQCETNPNSNDLCNDGPVFKTFTVELDEYSDFAIYRTDSNKVSEEDIIHNLQELKRPEKQGKWQPIYGQLKVRILNYTANQKNVLTSSFAPVKPFPEPPENTPILEVEEFTPEDGNFAQPHTVYKNLLYVYPKNLKYDAQKVFTKARNLAVHVEVRNLDSESAEPLNCIYERNGRRLFTSTMRCGVLHHNSNPDFVEEVKIQLPVQLHEKHHLVFTFFHVSCDIMRDRSSKKAQSIESVVGYAWFPITDKFGKVSVGEQNVKLATNMPSGYLGKGAMASDIKWVDSGKPLFKFMLHLNSTVYTTDQHLHRFFTHCNSTSGGEVVPAVTSQTHLPSSHETESVNKLKSLGARAELDVVIRSMTSSVAVRNVLDSIKGLHAVEVHTLICFLPILLNQLFRLLLQTTSEDVAQNATKVLIHIVSKVHEVDKPDILTAYVKYVFVTEPAASSKDKTVHEELANHLTRLLRPNQMDQHLVAKFMEHSGFFFDVLAKSMGQHLLFTGRIKMSRHERFPPSFQMNIQNLVVALAQHIVQKTSHRCKESGHANVSLALFIKRCFTFMDRGFVFRLTNTCIETFSSDRSDGKLLQEYRLEFLQLVCEHEHYVPLNLPMMKKSVKSYRDVKLADMKLDSNLTNEFCRNHFLVGLLLQEVRQALNVIKDVRKIAIKTLRNVLAKHCFDSRYKSRGHQERIATLYLPFISIILENKHRLTPKETIITTSHDHNPAHSHSTGTDSPHTASRSSTLDSRTTGSSEQNTGSSLDSSFAAGGGMGGGGGVGGGMVVGAGSGSSRDSTISSGDSSSLTPRSSQSLRRYQHDPSVFAMISGQVSTLNPLADIRRSQINGSSNSLDSTDSASAGNMRQSVSNISQVTLESSSSGTSTGTVTGLEERGTGSLSRTGSFRSSLTSVATRNNASGVARYDRLDQAEVKDLLVSFLFVATNLAPNVLLAWFSNSSELDVVEFFEVLEICMQQFKYMGRKRIKSLYIIGSSQKRVSMNLPASKKFALAPSSRANSMHFDGEGMPVETDGDVRAEMEAHLATEVSMTVLDIVSLYSQHFKEALETRDGDNATMQTVFNLHMAFLQNSQSELVQKNAFGTIRALIKNFSKVLFEGEAAMCGKLCFELLKCCNSRLSNTRNEACAVIYILMRANFEYCQRKSFTRVHLQMIIAVSQLVGSVDGLSSSRFIDSLSVMNSYANNDNLLKKTVFPTEVSDLMRRVRTVLMATARMREHQNDPEMLIDLQYSLAKSYTSTPELRKTWLESMAKVHIMEQNYSEAAHCYLHIAALVSEYLKRRVHVQVHEPGLGTGDVRRVLIGEFPQGCGVFAKISENVQSEEAGMRDDLGMQDVQYSMDTLTELLEECAVWFEKAERFEVLDDIYDIIKPIYKARREFVKMNQAFKLLAIAFDQVVEVMQSGRRLLGNYFKVSFYGQAYFEEESGKKYVYKEPKVTGLTEICDRLEQMYMEKFGRGKVRMLRDSGEVKLETLDPNLFYIQVKQETLDPNLAYIQITHVKPYFEQQELDDRLTDFEKSNNIRRFMYEMPFTKGGKAHGQVHEQWKRRTIIRTTHAFPYVTKRIQIEKQDSTELSPIEFAIDEMSHKVCELNEVVYQTKPDLKRLQLKLQGAVSTTVNAGPLAYAEAFLHLDSKYDADKVETLKVQFREFVNICHAALDLNGRLINCDQLVYQQALKENFRALVAKLSEIFVEPLLADELGLSSDRGSVSNFSVDSSNSNISIA